MKTTNLAPTNKPLANYPLHGLSVLITLLLVGAFLLPGSPQAIGQNTSLIRTARSICQDAGTPISVTPEGAGAPLYVFEENHASLKGQIQIATMLTRLYKREQMHAIGLEGSMSNDQPLPTKNFLQGQDSLARRDALRRMLLDGDLRATEYVASVNPVVELWGLEKAEEYNILPPSGISSSFLAVLAISEKLIPEEKLLEVVQLLKTHNLEKAIDLMKRSDPWIRDQLSRTNDDNMDLQAEIKHEQDILRKARQLGVQLPESVKTGMDQTIRFYQVADTRSETIAANMILLAKKQADKPSALVVGSAHADRVMRIFAAARVNAVLIKPLNLANSINDKGLAAFANKNNGRLASDDSNSFDFILNKTFPSKSGEPSNHPPPTFIENSNPSREALGSIQYATSLIAAAARGGRKIPQDIPEVLSPLPGGVSIDRNSFSQDGYDVTFSAVLTLPDRSKKRLWVRAGTARPGSRDASGEDIEQLRAADNEPPKEPPGDDGTGKHADNDPNGGKSERGKSEKGGEAAKAGHMLVDMAVEYKVFSNREEAKACPALSTQ